MSEQVRRVVYVLSSPEEWAEERTRLNHLNPNAMISTMTVQVLFDGRIDIERLYDCLEPTKFSCEIPTCVIQKKRFIEQIDYAISTIRFQGNLKGVNLNFRRRDQVKTFPRSISVTFLYQGRNINVKVCEGNLQTTGANEISQVIAVVHTLLQLIKRSSVETKVITHFLLHTCMINVCFPVGIQLDREEIQRRMTSYPHRKFRAEFVIDGRSTNVRLKTSSTGDIPLLLFSDRGGQWDNVKESNETVRGMIENIKKTPSRSLSLFIFQTGKMITSVKTLKDIIDLIPQITHALTLQNE